MQMSLEMQTNGKKRVRKHGVKGGKVRQRFLYTKKKKKSNPEKEVGKITLSSRLQNLFPVDYVHLHVL